MASHHMLWQPGTDYGACALSCSHLICSIKRAMADHPCSICGEKIGHDESFIVDEPVNYLTHADCIEKESARSSPSPDTPVDWPDNTGVKSTPLPFEPS
jgi:hypothetical protein